MNKIRHLLILTVVLTTSFSCKKDKNDRPKGNENFSEFFSCKINGDEFNPRGTFSCNNQSFYFYSAGMGGLEDSYMVIYGKDCPDSKTLAIRLFGIQHQVGYLNFLEPSFADSCSLPSYTILNQDMKLRWIA